MAAAAAVPDDSFDVQSVGRQFNSQKETMPAYSFGSSTRERQNKVFISTKHENSKAIMPSPGPIYTVTADMGEGPKFSFGTDEQRKHDKGKYPDSSVDLTCSMVDTQKIKFPTTKGVHFGTESRMSIKNAEILRTNPNIGMGMESPGGLEYTPNEHQILKGVPEYSFGPKHGKVSEKASQRINMPLMSSPRTLGPGSHTQPAGVGAQPSSKHASAPSWSLGNPPKKEEIKRVPKLQLDTSTELSSLGKQVVSSSRSAPQVAFGTSTRDMSAKTHLVMTDLDRGPQGKMGTPRFNLDLPKPIIRCPPKAGM